MPIHKVWIEEGCISCNLCEDLSPEVFQVPGGGTSKLRRGWKKALREEATQESCQEAADSCPVEVIQVQRKG